MLSDDFAGDGAEIVLSGDACLGGLAVGEESGEES